MANDFLHGSSPYQTTICSSSKLWLRLVLLLVVLSSCTLPLLTRRFLLLDPLLLLGALWAVQLVEDLALQRAIPAMKLMIRKQLFGRAAGCLGALTPCDHANCKHDGQTYSFAMLSVSDELFQIVGGYSWRKNDLSHWEIMQEQSLDGR
jgi:hypothetical protein